MHLEKRDFLDTRCSAGHVNIIPKHSLALKMDETGFTDTWAPLRKPDMSVLFDNAMFDSELS